MNKKLSTLLFSIAVAMVGTGLLSSCIKDELPNIEVDITNVTSQDKGFIKSIINENSVTVFVDTLNTKLNNLALTLEISEGATITPDPSTIKDYSKPQVFTISSEDRTPGRSWTKEWTINTQIVSANTPTKFGFENWYNPEHTAYQMPYDVVNVDGKNQNLYMWASTNNSLGILLAYMFQENLNYTHFGTSYVEDGVEGKAVKLRTWGIKQFDPSKPYCSGSLFLGEFDGADTDPLTGTHFGVPFNKKPVSFKGYYKFEPQKLEDGTDDTGLIEAVLYRVDSTTPYLTGYTIKDKTNKNIVAYAEIDPDAKTNGYVEFNIPFTYTQELNTEDLQNWKYGLTIYFTSSKRGDEYVGADNTCLYIDNVEVVCE